MAVVPTGRSRSRGGQIFGFGRYRGLGDAASDAILGSSWGSAALAAAQAAAAALPAGYTMGDPLSPLWGAAYYNGVKLMSPPDDPAVMALIQAAADAAYKVYAPIDAIRSSTNPYMQAVLLDPEWIALEGTGQQVIWDQLSAELQAKIKLVPNLYNLLIGNLSAIPAYVQPAAPTGPARYLIGGIEFLDNGTVVSINGKSVTGITLTPDEVHSLITTGALPAGDSGPAAPAPPSTSTTSTTTTPGPAILTPPPQQAIPVTLVQPPQATPIDAPPRMVDGMSSGSASFDPTGWSSSSPAPVAPATAGFNSKWLLWGGVAIAALTFLNPHTRPSASRRHRRR